MLIRLSYQARLNILKAFTLAVFLSPLVARTISAQSTPSCVYVYDADGRLIQTTVTDGPVPYTIFYAYDSAGNLISVTSKASQ
jgi:YD repeat-containing protein